MNEGLFWYCFDCGDREPAEGAEILDHKKCNVCSGRDKRVLCEKMVVSYELWSSEVIGRHVAWTMALEDFVQALARKEKGPCVVCGKSGKTRWYAGPKCRSCYEHHIRQDPESRAKAFERLLNKKRPMF